MIRRKYESLDGIYPDIREYYENNCDGSCFVNAESIANTTEDCIEYLVTECGYDEDVVNSDAWYLKIKRYLVRLANESESLNHKLESRIRRLEKFLRKNEATTDVMSAMRETMSSGITDYNSVVAALESDYNIVIGRDVSAGSFRNTYARLKMTEFRDNQTSAADDTDITLEIENWFNSHLAPRCFDSKREWLAALRMLSNKGDDYSVEDCASSVGANSSEYNTVANELARLAKNILNMRRYSDGNGVWREDGAWY